MVGFSKNDLDALVFFFYQCRKVMVLTPASDRPDYQCLRGIVDRIANVYPDLPNPRIGDANDYDGFPVIFHCNVKHHHLEAEVHSRWYQGDQPTPPGLVYPTIEWFYVDNRDNGPFKPGVGGYDSVDTDYRNPIPDKVWYWLGLMALDWW